MMPTADISRAAVGIMTAARAERPATYQDVLDTPAHRVAEVRAGPCIRSPARHLSMPERVQALGPKSARHSTLGMAARRLVDHQ